MDVQNLSRHNYYPSKALDVVVVNEKGYKTYMKRIIIVLYLFVINFTVSGGSWLNFKDWPHIQTAI